MMSCQISCMGLPELDVSPLALDAAARAVRPDDRPPAPRLRCLDSPDAPCACAGGAIKPRSPTRCEN